MYCYFSCHGRIDILSVSKSKLIMSHARTQTRSKPVEIPNFTRTESHFINQWDASDEDVSVFLFNCVEKGLRRQWQQKNIANSSESISADVKKMLRLCRSQQLSGETFPGIACAVACCIYRHAMLYLLSSFILSIVSLYFFSIFQHLGQLKISKNMCLTLSLSLPSLFFFAFLSISIQSLIHRHIHTCSHTHSHPFIFRINCRIEHLITFVVIACATLRYTRGHQLNETKRDETKQKKRIRREISPSRIGEFIGMRHWTIEATNFKI